MRLGIEYGKGALAATLHRVQRSVGADQELRSRFSMLGILRDPDARANPHQRLVQYEWARKGLHNLVRQQPDLFAHGRVAGNGDEFIACETADYIALTQDRSQTLGGLLKHEVAGGVPEAV